MIKRLISSCVALLLFSSAGNALCASELGRSVIPGVAQVPSITLKESILFAFNRDPSIGQQAAQMGIGQAQIDEARSAWMPQISLSGNAGHSQTTDSNGSLSNSMAWGLSITQLVYDFGKTSNSINQSKKQFESYRFQLMATFTKVAEKTALGYAEVNRYTMLTDEAKNSVKALEDVLQLARLRANAGLSSSSDVLQTQTRIAGLQATLEQYKAALKSARARLAVLTGINADRYSPLPPTLNIQEDSLDNIDYTLIPSVLAARSMESSSEYAVARAKAQHWPTLSVRGGRTRYQSDNRAYWDSQIQLNVDAPIYQGGAVSARVSQAEGAHQMAATQVDQARFDVLQKASVAIADWAGAKGRVEAGQVQLESAVHTRQVYKNEYTLSKRSINDLLSVEQDVWQAKLAKITAEYDCWNAAITYAAALDSLLPMTGIEKNLESKLPELG